MLDQKTVMRTPLLLACLLLVGGCARSPIFDGPTLGENPELLGPNITAEMQAGEFFLGQGDQVQVAFWNQPDLSRTYRVDAAGVIHPFLVGEMSVGGLSAAQLRQSLTEAYKRYYVDPHLDVAVQASPLRKVTVAGQVSRPGVYPLDYPRITVLDMIARAGGLAPDGDTTGVVVAREVEGQWQVTPYNLDLMFEPEDPAIKTQIPFVQPGDYVYVVRTPLAVFSERMRTVNDVLRGVNFVERAILLTPRTADALDF